MMKEFKFKDLSNKEKKFLIMDFISKIFLLLSIGILASISVHAALIMISLLIGADMINKYGVFGKIVEKV